MPRQSLCFATGTDRVTATVRSYLELLDDVGHRSREGDVSGEVAAAVEGEVEAVGAPHAQLPEVVGLPVELANELLLAREVAEHVGAGQVTANKRMFLTLNPY